MWGYGARHALPATGTMMPLYAKAVVLQVGGDKLALMGLDLGRAPTFASMAVIREEVKKQSGVGHVMIVGSHTHHGPVLELIDEPDFGKGKYDEAVTYVDTLEQKIIAAINEAAANVAPAKIGWGSRDTDLNRNRHTERKPKPRDPELAVIRFDDLDGNIIALAVNFAAHPTIAGIQDRRWSAEWPGQMQRKVEEAMGGPCLFLQGAAGDLSPNTNDQRRGVEGFGNAMAEAVVEIAKTIEPKVPDTPAIEALPERTFEYEMRIDIQNPVVQGVFKQAFFPEMLAMTKELPDNKIYPRLKTVLINERLALVGGSGEFFSALATMLKERSKAEETFFLGYCNGHQMYFPTQAAVEDGAYGADPAVAWVPPHAGKEIIETALEQVDGLVEENASE